MEKFCIFCGGSPTEKTKEHVIPAWLIEFTGHNKRPIRFHKGIDKTIPFDQFVFPACSKCNSEYSELEERAKAVITKITNRDFISEIDSIHLLDWFDKVRVGLWLGMRYLTKDECQVDPKFHINTRIRQTDRMLGFYSVKESPKGINFTGVDTILFQYLPSCFLLRINDLYIQNIAGEMLFAHRLGFPTIIERGPSASTPGALDIRFGPPRTTAKRPRLSHLNIRPIFSIYQPVIPKDARGIRGTPYDSPLIKGKCIDWENGVGKVFIEDSEIRLFTHKFSTATLDDSQILFDRPKEYELIRQNYQIHRALSEEINAYTYTKEGLKEIKQQVQLATYENSKVIKHIESHITASKNYWGGD